MRFTRYYPVLVAAFALVLVSAPTPRVVQVIAGVSLTLLIPGYALGRVLIDTRGPSGESTVLATGISIAITGFVGLLLALVHVFERTELIAAFAVVTAGTAGAVYVQRRPTLDKRRTQHVSVQMIAFNTVAVAVASLLLTMAFVRDSSSSAAQLRSNSVALAAVREGTALSVQVMPSRSSRFSGSVLVRSTSSTIGTRLLRGIGPGGQWSFVVQHVPSGSLEVILLEGHTQIRVLYVAPLDNRGGST
jgi:hypothetical protein